ncbi:MAG: GIY-YIG nuclease family protein [Gelidibacter sp.]
MKFYYVYILKCSDDTYYTGFTSNLEQRLTEHQSGKHRDSYTYSRRPVTLEFYQEFVDPNQAIMIEKQIKKWSKVKKEALINGEFEKLPNLAKKKFK